MYPQIQSSVDWKDYKNVIPKRPKELTFLFAVCWVVAESSQVQWREGVRWDTAG